MKASLNCFKLLIATFLLFSIGCGKKKSSLPLINFSFENSGVGSVAGWYHYCDSAAAIPVYNGSTPPGGGSWSLSLHAYNPPSCYARYYVLGQSGTQVYRVKGWISDVNLTGAPFIKIGKYALNTYSQTKIVVSPGTTTAWTNYVMHDTITTLPGDTIALEVSGGFSPVGGTGLFDLITLERIEP